MTELSSAPHPVVLQVLPALGGGGVERGTVEMSAAITKAGGTALVASAGGMLASSVERAGGRNVLIKSMPSKNPWRIWRNASVLADVIRSEKVDLVHARSRAPAWSAYWATRRTGTPFVTTYHGAYNENVVGKRRYNEVMAKGDLVIAISNFIANLILTRHHIDPARIRIAATQLLTMKSSSEARGTRTLGEASEANRRR